MKKKKEIALDEWTTEEYIDWFIEETKKTLINKCIIVSRNLEHLAIELQEKGIETCELNTLGELQSSGPEIDRLCGVLGTLKYIKRNSKAKECKCEEINNE